MPGYILGNPGAILELAVYDDRPDYITWLLNTNLDPNTPYLGHALIWAVYDGGGHPESLRELLRPRLLVRNGEFITYHPPPIEFSLMQSAIGRDPAILQALIDGGGNIHEKDDRLLWYVVTTNRPEMVKLLLRNGDFSETEKSLSPLRWRSGERCSRS